MAVLATAGAILTYQLFVPPVVGLADQGDFVRTIRRFGYEPQHHGSFGYVYVEPKYIPDPHSRSSDWEQANSEYLFVGAALLLNKVVSKDGALDITVAGFVHALAFLAAFARLLWVGRHDQAYVLLWIGALVALTDAGYAVYWNSFYAEPASCIFFLLLLAEGVESARTGETSLAAALRWSLWSVLWILAKPQNAPIGLILGLFTFRLAMRTPSNPARVVAAVGGCAMFAGAVFDAVAVPTYGHQANTYGMVFSGILPESKNPEADLRALGLDPQLAKYSGTGAWTPRTYFPQIAASGALKRVNTLGVLGFYLVRPARMWRRLHGLLPEITFLRWNSYGNFELSAGLPPAAQSRAFTLWSGFHEHILPSVNKWIVFALAGWPLVAAWRWGRDRDLARRRRLELLTLLPVCCLAALFSAVYGDAFDVIKHMYLFNLLLDTCILYIAAAGWSWAAINLLDSNAIGTRVMRMLRPSTPLGRTTLWFISGVCVLIALRWIVYIEFPRPPLVRITSPQSLAVFGAGDSIPLSVTAQYPAGEGGSIQVMLSGLAGRNMVVCGGPANACRLTMWDQAPPGNYTLQASLFDPSGALIATSGNAISFSVSRTLAAGAQVRVLTKSNQPPSTTAQTPIGPLVNAGSFVGPIAPGALVSVFVSVGTLPITQATSLPLPTTLSGLALAINGRSTPLLYASGTQVNAQLPYEVSPGNYTASLSLNTAVTHTFSCTVTPAAPGIFTFGNNRAVAQNQDYTVNGVNNPAKAGSVITLYFTGQGVPDNAVATGEAAPLPPAPLSAAPATVSATIGGQPAALFFVGLTPKFVGLSQANIRIPASLPPGTYPVQLEMGSQASNSPLLTTN